MDPEDPVYTPFAMPPRRVLTATEIRRLRTSYARMGSLRRAAYRMGISEPVARRYVSVVRGYGRAIRDSAIALHSSGVSVREVAARVRVSRETVYNWLRSSGLQRNRVRGRKPAQLSIETTQTILRMYSDDGLAVRDVAIRLGLSKRAVHRTVKSASLSRPRGGREIPNVSALKAAARALRHDGLSISEITVRLAGPARSVVGRWLQQS